MGESVSEYTGLAVFLLLGTGLATTFLLVTTVLGPKLRFASKQEPFECGERQLGSPYRRLNIKFYMVAVSFIIFDVEMVFLYPWAVAFRDLGWFGLAVMLPFLALLTAGLAYEWLRGGLDWS